jgi:hypothetical protein
MTPNEGDKIATLAKLASEAVVEKMEQLESDGSSS